MDAPRLILASTSPYRRQLLERLGLPFTVQAAGVDEAAHTDETPTALCQRLADEKAVAVARQHPQAWVIGSDQVAERDGLPLGKPGTHVCATAQLRAASGRRVSFHTAVCLLHHATQTAWRHVDVTHVRFRELAQDAIERYLRAEQPYDCAGSFKSEGLGIALFESIDSQDPTALIGLPLIGLARLLRAAGFEVP